MHQYTTATIDTQQGCRVALCQHVVIQVVFDERYVIGRFEMKDRLRWGRQTIGRLNASRKDCRKGYEQENV